MEDRQQGQQEADFTTPIDQALPFRMGADVAKYFVEAGTSLLDLLFRCSFLNERKRLAYMADIDYCTEYGIKDGIIEITTHLASSDSVAAARIERFLAGITAGASRGNAAPPEKRGIFDLGKYTKKTNNGGDGGYPNS
jgi:hypothetical protein